MNHINRVKMTIHGESLLFKLFIAISLTVSLTESLSPPKSIDDATELSEDKQKDVQHVIDQWQSDKALDRTPGVIVSSQFATLDLNETTGSFDKYIVQVDNSTYSSVHLQKKLVFDAAIIRRAFEVSRDTRSHVLFTSPFGVHSNPEGMMYFSCQLSNKSGRPFWVWSLLQTMDKLKSKLRIKNCEELRSTNDFISDVLSLDS